MKNTIHEFPCGIYPRVIWVSVGATVQSLNDLFETKYSEMDESADAEVTGNRRLKPDIKGGILIRFRNKKDMTTSIISHEATHAALEIFDYVGAVVDPKNQEPFTYLVGWIADCINQVKIGKFKE